MRRFAVLALVLFGCGDDAPSGARLIFDPEAARQPGRFFDAPYPSDLRLGASGGPDLANFPNPQSNPLVAGLLATAAQRGGFPVVPVGYFHFTAQPALQDPERVIAAAFTSPILLVDVGDGATRGRLVPTVADTPIPDDYVPDFLLAVAARPGFVLTARRPYAFVVLRTLSDDSGKLLAPMSVPSAAAAALAPAFAVLAEHGIKAGDVAAATVFTTGDVVAELADLGDKLRARHPLAIAEPRFHRRRRARRLL